MDNQMVGFQTLFSKEITRFLKVGFQTIGAPVLTALRYLLIFSNALRGRIEVYPGSGIDYLQFLVPGLAVMSLLQNAFANTSSSIAQSKMMGNIVFVLLPPISHLEFFLAYVLAAVVRGLIVGFVVVFASLLFVALPIENLVTILTFGFLGATMLGSLGLIAGIWADKFDQIAAFQNFVILPMTFLSGVFYSVHDLPNFWQLVSYLNPFFYLIDGFRAGFFGVSDVDVLQSLIIVSAVTFALSFGCFLLIRAGYKLRS
jgi:ABC-2 type transport system permease protein